MKFGVVRFCSILNLGNVRLEPLISWIETQVKESPSLLVAFLAFSRFKDLEVGDGLVAVADDGGVDDDDGVDSIETFRPITVFACSFAFHICELLEAK